MTIKTVFRFQFGSAEAIRSVAQSQSALWTGLMLVLLTAIARSYDQTFILEKPFLWLFGPVLFSFGSAALIFGLIYVTFIRRHLPEDRAGPGTQFLSFLGLFWMTAPIAWLYAIPVERFFTSYQAAQANLALLAIVALWRVLLLARVFSVVQGAPFWRTLLWVLIPASIEVIALYVFGGPFAQTIMRGMGGMRNSPEEELLLRALSFSAGAAFWIGLAAIVTIAILRNVSPFQSFPNRQADRMPLVSLVVLAMFWIGVSIYPQTQLQKNFRVEQLMKAEKYKDAIQFLSEHEPEDFAPARQLPPKLYEREIFDQLPKVFEAMDGNEQEWVRQTFFNYLEIMIRHRTFFRLNRSFEPLRKDVERLPGGAEWLERNEKEFIDFVKTHEPEPANPAGNPAPSSDNTNNPPK